jgi:hypothetical protein
MAGPTNRARKYGGGGGGIDLGGLLMAIYGGVEANPAAAMQGPTPSGQALGGGDPYKARTIFDRNEASSMNAQYRAGQMAEDSALSRRFEEARGMLPIKKDDYLNQQSAQTTGHKDRGLFDQGIDNEKATRDAGIAKEKAGLDQVLAVLQTNGIAANPYDIKKYMADINPEQFKALLDGLQTKMATNQALRADTERDQLVKGGTFPDLLSTMQTQAKTSRSMAEGEATQVPAMLDYKNMKREQDLKGGEIELLRGRYMPGAAPIVDILANPMKPAYTPPQENAALQEAINKLNTKSGLVPQTANLQTNMAQTAIEPMVEVEIDGMRVKIPQSQAAKLTGAR